MPGKARRVSSGNVEVRHRGTIKGWETAELCTNDPAQVGAYLNNFPARTRVWVSAFGTVYQYQGRRGGRQIQRGEEAHVSLTANVELRLMTSERVEDQIDRNMAVFRNPQSGEFDIEYYCIRTKEPLQYNE